MISQDELVKLMVDMETDLVEKRSAFARTFDALPCKGSNLEDISIALFKLRYLPSAIDAETLAENNRELRQQPYHAIRPDGGIYQCF